MKILSEPYRWLFVLLIGTALLLGACALRETQDTAIQPEPVFPSASPSFTAPAQTGGDTLPALTVTLTTTPSVTPITPSLTPPPPSRTPTETRTPTVTFTPVPTVPSFTRITVIVLENREFGFVIDNPQMPNFNRWANEYTLLTQFYALLHPSLPNYLALIGGDTFGVDYTCYDCYQQALTLPELIEASGRTWKAYQEDMPEPCFAGIEYKNYTQRHNPFAYFDSVRLNPERCQRSVVPFEQFYDDLATGSLPDFIFITPNQCHNAHDCSLNVADSWLGGVVPYLMSEPVFMQGGLIVLTWDEGQGDHGCCGFDPGGGRIATVLMSPLAQSGFQDATPYTHYSLLKMIASAWGLPLLGHAADPSQALILAPWQR